MNNIKNNVAEVELIQDIIIFDDNGIEIDVNKNKDTKKPAKKLVFNNNAVSKFITIEKDWIVNVESYLGEKGWLSLCSGGNGNMVEEIIIDFFKDHHGFTNILKSKSTAEAWDLEVFDCVRVSEDTRHEHTFKSIEIRRVSKDGKVNLGHTGQNKAGRTNFRDKMAELTTGGYLFVNCKRTIGMELSYVPARVLLEAIDRGNKEKKGDTMAVSSINRLLEIDI